MHAKNKHYTSLPLCIICTAYVKRHISFLFSDIKFYFYRFSYYFLYFFSTICIMHLTFNTFLFVFVTFARNHLHSPPFTSCSDTNEQKKNRILMALIEKKNKKRYGNETTNCNNTTKPNTRSNESKIIWWIFGGCTKFITIANASHSVSISINGNHLMKKQKKNLPRPHPHRKIQHRSVS